MKGPNFFIAGAPKCGTTSLANYLRDLDGVFVTRPKEPHFFASDLSGYRFAQNIDEYEALFSGATNESAVGEASVFYLFSEVALSNIRRFNPNAKIIVMLRNPIDLVYSLHSQMLFSHDEDIADFGEAWRHIETRRRGDRIPSRCRDAKLLQYDKVAMLGEQMQRLYELFPRENVLVIFFEDFITNTEVEFRRAADFLGVDSQDRKVFPRINENRRHRSAILSDLLFNRTSWLKRPVRKIKSILGLKKFGVLGFLRNLETKREVRKQLDAALREAIRANYADDLRLLERLVDRKLDDWT